MTQLKQVNNVDDNNATDVYLALHFVELGEMARQDGDRILSEHFIEIAFGVLDALEQNRSAPISCETRSDETV